MCRCYYCRGIERHHKILLFIESMLNHPAASFVMAARWLRQIRKRIEDLNQD